VPPPDSKPAADACARPPGAPSRHEPLRTAEAGAAPRRIAIVTDAWHPQVNGVVRTYDAVGRALESAGHDVSFVTPAPFRTVPCPTYPSIRLALFPRGGVRERLRALAPDAVHIATEGPLGHAARAICRRQRLAFTTSFHTQFPEYVRARVPVPVDLSYRYLQRFHAGAVRTLVPTASQRDRLLARGFRNLSIWARGVDTSIFRPGPKSFLDGPRPVAMYVGRVAVEKNMEAFLSLDLPGTKYVVGDGPDLRKLRDAWPRVRFTGRKVGRELAAHMAAADVFVFPSRTDTYGIVLLESMACGVPVAAFPVTGPVDVVQPGRTGVLDEDLRAAALAALELAPGPCIEFARERSWERCAREFATLLVPANAAAGDAAPA